LLVTLPARALIEVGAVIKHATDSTSLVNQTEAGKECLDNKAIYIRSHRNVHLQDDNGNVKLNANRGSWEKWTMKAAGDNKYFVRSHRNQNLLDNDGNVMLTGNTGSWEKWTIKDAGNGKVFLRSHRSQNLQDKDGKLVLSGNTGAWESWTITDALGSPVCQASKKASKKTSNTKELFAVSSSTENGCTDPAAEDAEAIECECLEELTTDCAAAGVTDTEECFLTSLCNHQNICASWKSENCEDGSSLLERRSITTSKANGTLDGSVTGKCTSETQ